MSSTTKKDGSPSTPLRDASHKTNIPSLSTMKSGVKASPFIDPEESPAGTTSAPGSPPNALNRTTDAGIGLGYHFGQYDSNSESESASPSMITKFNDNKATLKNRVLGSSPSKNLAAFNASFESMPIKSKQNLSTVASNTEGFMATRGVANPYAAAAPSPARSKAGSVAATPATEDALRADYPTDLHAACSQVGSTIRQFKSLLRIEGNTAAETPDVNSRLPLHLLGMNELLVNIFLKKARATNNPHNHGLPTTDLDDFVLELVKTHQHGCITVDNEGWVPFTKILNNWVLLASRGDLPNEGIGETLHDRLGEDANNRNPLMAGDLEQGITADDTERPPPAAANHQLEGMEQVVQQHVNQGNGRDDNTLGSRSVWTSLTNITLPSAFKSVYTESRTNELGINTRALYRARADTLDGTVEEETRTPGAPMMSNRGGPTPMTVPSGGIFFSNDERSLGSFSSAPGPSGIDDCFPNNPTVPAVVEWSLKMLSNIIDYLENCPVVLVGNAEEEDGTVMGAWQAQQRRQQNGAGSNFDVHTHYSSEWVAKTLVAAVSSVPSLMKTLLLVDDKDPAKQRLFNMTIVKRMIYSPHTIGNWLVYMLEAIDGDVASRGVQYIELLSSDPETPDFYGGSNSSTNKGIPTPEERAKLYKRVSRLDYLHPAILALEDIDMCNRVANTHLMRHIQDEELRKRQTLLMAFFDLLFHLLLIGAFTSATFFYLGGGEYGGRYLVTFFVGFFCIIYRIAWKFAQMASMIKISRSAFTANSFRPGDLYIEILSLCMTMAGYLWMEFTIEYEGEGNKESVNNNFMKGYLAVTIGMLWLSLLRWFYVINWQVNTFVDLLKQIVNDIKVFFFVLAVTIVAFAQMFQVLLYKPQDECTDGGFCDPKDVYLKLYSAMLGKFDLDDFTTSFSLVVFIFFSILVTFVFLYALIAIVIEANSKFITARFSTALPKHGTRARLVYVAHLRAFRRMLEQRWSFMQYVALLLFFASTGLILALCLREIRQHFDEFYGDTLLAVIFGLLIFFLFVGILAFVSHMTYFEMDENKSSAGSFFNRIIGSCLVKSMAWPIHSLMLLILGVPKEEGNEALALSSTKSEKKAPNDIAKKWGGTAVHIHSDVKRMIDVSQEQTMNMVAAEFERMEARTRYTSHQAKADLLADVQESQERMEKMMSQIRSMLSGEEAADTSILSKSSPMRGRPPRPANQVSSTFIPNMTSSSSIGHTPQPSPGGASRQNHVPNLIGQPNDSPARSEKDVSLIGTVGPWSILDGHESL